MDGRNSGAKSRWAHVAFCSFWSVCILLAAASALPYAGNWNDGSRLASVEALVDHGTFIIDDSVFVCVPPDTIARGVAPYRDYLGVTEGTYDKLWINGHFYSDKPALISLLMAALYQAWLWLGGTTAALRPDLFCLVLTWGTSGLAYLLTLVCVYRLGCRLRLPTSHCLLLCASMAFATVALVYARHVNNHVLLLAVSAALMLHLVAFAQEHEAGRVRRSRLLLLGTLSGLGYALDLGLGPALLVSLSVALFWRTRSWRDVAWCFVGALPWLAAHHALNYAIGGVIKPMNMVPEYSDWPGSAFDASNLTGFSRHSLGGFFIYAAALLYGKNGILGYNLPLLLALPAGACVWRTLRSHRSLVGFALLWCGGGWLMYSVLSNNFGGMCCSIRWFVPFLAPGFLLIALALRERPALAWDLAVLSAWGALLTLLLWRRGPWSNKMTPAFWPIQGLALLSWWACARRRVARAALEMETEPVVATLHGCQSNGVAMGATQLTTDRAKLAG
jgi:hypothetical protein